MSAPSVQEKPRYLMPCRGIIPSPEKTQALEFNDRGDIDTPGEYFSHPRWYHALITTLQDVDTLIYVHAANDTESRLPPGLLDIGSRKHLIVRSAKRICRMPMSPRCGSCWTGWGFRRRFSPSTVAIRKALRRWKIT
ncbi:Ethanolamine utilization protein EutP [Klebsiella pneumoniae ISC21]|nr:Ethanolamine utilization protein EutP [Klebsiella pneumoniae ISC21]